MDDQGLNDAAIFLMSLGEEEASEVFKHLSPKEVQKLGETIARLKIVPRDRLARVLERFATNALDQHALVWDTVAAAGTALLLAGLGRPTLRALARFRDRLQFEVRAA